MWCIDQNSKASKVNMLFLICHHNYYRQIRASTKAFSLFDFRPT